MQPAAHHPALDPLAVLVGGWETEATHRLLPGTVIYGRATFEWLEGGYFLVQRMSADHPDFPSGVMVIGGDDAAEAYSLLYADSRGVSRIFQMSLRDGVWTYWRDAPGFAQRFTGTLSPDGQTIDGVVELCTDGITWEQDLLLTYKRVT